MVDNQIMVDRDITIFIVGEVSSGKSSFINGLAAGFISNVSLQRETFYPLGYIFSPKGNYQNVTNLSKSLVKIHEQCIKIRNEDFTKNNETPLGIEWQNNLDTLFPSFLPVGNTIKIIDFPGLNDAVDKSEQFLNSIKENISICDLIIFVTDASHAFVNASEVNNFRKINEYVKNELKNGHYVDLIIIVNKFDNINDHDLNEIYERAIKQINCKSFKVSAHKLFIDNIKDNNVFIPLNHNIYLNEFNKILKNSNTHLASNKRNKNEMIITKYDIYSGKFLMDNIDSNNDKEIDHTDLYTYMKNFIGTLNDNKILILTEQFNDLLKNYIFNNCIETYHFSEIVHSYEKWQIFQKWIDIAEDYGFRTLIDDSLCNLILQLKTERYFTIGVIDYYKKYASVNNMKKIIEHILNAQNFYSLDKLFVLAILNVNDGNQYEFGNIVETSDIIKILLSDKSVWDNRSIKYYDLVEMEIANNYIHNYADEYLNILELFNASNKNETIKILMKLALMPLYKLKSYADLNLLPYDKINVSDVRLKIRFAINKSDNYCLKNLLFEELSKEAEYIEEF